jgi:hypothetical protein
VAEVETVQRYSSRIDAWVLLLMLAAIAGQILAIVALLVGGVPGPAQGPVIVLLVPGIALVALILVRIHYTIADGTLRVVSGPFAWSMAIVEIKSITESRSPLSSPALSLDRLQIDYGSGRRILVSPADKQRFLEAIEECHS